MAVSGVMVRLPAMISLIRRVGRPMISASSVCDQPRASSSSLRNSPGGKISAAVFIQASLGRSVVIADGHDDNELAGFRSEEHTSELQSLMRISYAGFCLKKK